jgi:hypothetical protein
MFMQEFNELIKILGRMTDNVKARHLASPLFRVGIFAVFSRLLGRGEGAHSPSFIRNR